MAMHTSTISNWCNQGIIKGIKVKGSWRIKRADLEEFKEHRANGHIPQGTRFVESPQPDRPELSDRVKKIHADAAQMVWDRQDILAKLFPHPQPDEVYDYVLHNMAPSGLSKMPSAATATAASNGSNPSILTFRSSALFGAFSGPIRFSFGPLLTRGAYRVIIVRQ